ncbi:MAG: N-acetylmuramoyl-L-alanine amidase [Bacteroidetes bacterium]|nr:N-acetylmuramoyl-L-alanine amidase [Bacteroidota bacterium]
MNRLVSLLVLICLTSFVHAGNPSQGAAVHTLVIDPGHGGMDPGAIGPGGHHEADLALAVSLKFGEMVKEAFPDVKIIYTRTTDKFVSLADRADMANKAKADLFICIHLNSATNHDAYGTSTYVLGLHRTDDNLEIAKRENAVIDLEANKDKKYDFDPNSPEGHIIMSMKQNAFLDQSILIASKIEDELAQLSKRKSRGVKQAGFWVLYKTAMPSLLAEIGFISNPTEEQYLSSDAGQTNIATSVYKAFRAYKNEIEGRKDTEVVAVKAPVAVAEKKKEVLTEVPPQPDPKTAQSSPNPGKQPQEAEPQKQPDPKAQQSPTIKLNPQEVKKEEKAWEPDTSAFVPSSVVTKESTSPTLHTPEKPAPTANKDSDEIKIRTATPEIMTKKLVPVRTGNEPSAKKEEPKPAAKVVKEETKAIAKKEESKPAKVVKEETKVVAKKEEPKPSVKVVKEETKVVAKKETPKPVTKEPVKAAVDTIKKKTTVTTKTTETKTEKTVTTKARADTVKTAAAKKEAAPVKKEPVAKKEPVTTKATPKKETPAPAANASSDNIIFTVQILAAHKPPKNYDDLVNTFGLINREDIGDGVIRYMAGQFSHFREAEKTLELAKSKGFPTAFIICYQDNVRLDVKKTREIGLKHP